MDAQSSGSVNQTQNPQTNSPTLFSQTQGVQPTNEGSFSLNTSSSTGSIDVLSVPNTSTSSVSNPAPAAKKNYTPWVTSGVLLVVAATFSIVFMRISKTPNY